MQRKQPLGFKTALDKRPRVGLSGTTLSEMAGRPAVSAIRCHSWVEISKYECFKIVKTQAERDGYAETALEIELSEDPGKNIQEKIGPGLSLF